MTKEEVRKYAFKDDDDVIDIVDTGKEFQGWKIYGLVLDRDPDKAYGPPRILLVKGDVIRSPTSKEYLEVLALANADYVGEDEEEDEEDA